MRHDQNDPMTEWHNPDSYEYVRRSPSKPRSVRVAHYRTPFGILVLVGCLVFWNLMKEGIPPVVAILITMLLLLVTVVIS